MLEESLEKNQALNYRWGTAATLATLGDAALSLGETTRAEHLIRLRDLKKQWDPQNLFRMNQNIPPAD